MTWSYRLRYVRCGKRGCTVCREEPAHGPYWYAYEHRGGRVYSKYVGKLPPNAEFARQEAFNKKDARWEFHGKMSYATAMRIMGFEVMPTLPNLTKRWRELVGAHHPDRGGDLKICQAINAAYTFLKR